MRFLLTSDTHGNFGVINDLAASAVLKAKHFQELIKQELVKNRTELAKKGGLTRARVTQILNLLKLAPEIQDCLSGLTDESVLRYFTERRLRGISTEKDHKSQIKKFEELKRKAGLEEIIDETA
jgi:hypothetical protein